MDEKTAEKTPRRPGKKAATRARLMEVRAKRAAEREARERANITDLTEFFVQTELHDDVDVWLREQIAKVTQEAKERRLQHRTAAGVALKAMADRGEKVSAIAEQAEITVAKVRTYLGLADGAAATRPATDGRGARPAAPPPNVEAGDAPGSVDVTAHTGL
ncbi:MAG: hypothetical protein QG655_1231 [Actinomycetota bacterium]|jgi:hypothetical protein|nr:hypothetical protein [Actinomycetota bacterium]